MAASLPDLEVIFEDDHVIAVVKPAGLATANVAPGQTSVHGLLRQRFGGNGFVGIVSRLDAPVSGVVVVAKTPAAAASLAAQFRDRSVIKQYEAVVTGRFPAPLGTWLEWRDAISRRAEEPRSLLHPAAAAREAGGDESPRLAVTRARVTQRAGEVSLVELEPETGRRHQLRLQLASRGCAIVGDRLYGSRLPFPAGIALHARRLALAHPDSGGQLQLEAPWPAAWLERFPHLEGSGSCRPGTHPGRGGRYNPNP
jgi:23S rRNA pseudouridine1911/1915/1917 synthase